MMDAIIAIERYTDGYDFEQFVTDAKTGDAVARNLMILGEAANRIPIDYREQHPDVEWTRIIRSRHVIVHDYFDLDHEIIWRIITVHLPELKQTLNSLLSSSNSPTE